MRSLILVCLLVLLVPVVRAETKPGGFDLDADGIKDWAAGDANLNGLFDLAGPHFAPNLIHLFGADVLGGYSNIWNSAAATPPGAYIDIAFADTDLDGRTEIIVCAGGSSPTSGLVAIWEHSGVVGQNSYVRVHAYSTVSYLFDADLGDADNDGYPEVILGLGGFDGFPLYIRRVEFDPASRTGFATVSRSRSSACL